MKNEPTAAYILVFSEKKIKNKKRRKRLADMETLVTFATSKTNSELDADAKQFALLKR
jgi:hypothetical protein